ncbi:MAG: J domain-containing protein [Desulfuromonadaceae bacterium]|nr:J domain-containing protein [Desulfuromonadaceae bacterium]
MTWNELEKALAIFSLSGPITLGEIKVRHRALIKKYHPDAAAGGENDRIREVNAAFRVLVDYCREFRFSLTREEFLNQHPEERLRQQFADNVVWGKASE